MPTILIIEDEVHMRLFIRSNLTTRGYTLLEAGTGAHGLHLLRDTGPDAVILDMLLPDITGWHVLDAMFRDEQLKAIPVILMTASVNIGETTNYPNLVRHLVKPVSVEALLEALQAAISP